MRPVVIGTSSMNISAPSLLLPPSRQNFQGARQSTVRPRRLPAPRLSIASPDHGGAAAFGVGGAAFGVGGTAFGVGGAAFGVGGTAFDVAVAAVP
jgi:hypothetical protein